MGLHEAAEMLIYRSLIPEKKRNAELQVLYDDDSHYDDNNTEVRAFFVHLLKATYLGKVSPEQMSLRWGFLDRSTPLK